MCPTMRIQLIQPLLTKTKEGARGGFKYYYEPLTHMFINCCLNMLYGHSGKAKTTDYSY
jgi:hypothetical protein